MSKSNKYAQPSLPEGYYFRVSESTRWMNHVDLYIMRKRWLFDKQIAGTTCRANTVSIAISMNNLKDEWEERKKQSKLLGDYPPKKLGDM